MKIIEVPFRYELNETTVGIAKSNSEMKQLMIENVGSYGAFSGGAGSYNVLNVDLEPIIIYKVPVGKRAKIMKTIDNNINVSFSSIHTSYYNSGNNKNINYQTGGIGKNGNPPTLVIGNTAQIKIVPKTFNYSYITYENVVSNTLSPDRDTSLSYSDLKKIEVDNYFLLENEEIKFTMDDFSLYSFGSHYQAGVINTRHTIEIDVFLHILEEDNI